MSQIRIFANDGGGIFGLMPATVSAELERRLGGPLAPHFNMLAGTSAGALNVVSLARVNGRPLLTAEELRQVYIRQGHDIFRSSIARDIETAHGSLLPRYDVASLKRVVQGITGEHWLHEVDDDLIAIGYDLRNLHNQYFESWAARDGRSPALTSEADPRIWDYKLSDVMLGSSAAPTYFPAHYCESASGEPHLIIDGGVTSDNNPARKALLKAVQLYGLSHEYLVVSLGTGSADRTFSGPKSFDKGLIQWAPHLLPTVFQASARSVNDDLSGLLGKQYVRLDADFMSPNSDLQPPHDQLAAASDENLERIQEWSLKLVKDNERTLDNLCEEIIKNPKKSKAELLAEAGRPMPPAPAPPPLPGPLT